MNSSWVTPGLAGPRGSYNTSFHTSSFFCPWALIVSAFPFSSGVIFHLRNVVVNGILKGCKVFDPRGHA